MDTRNSGRKWFLLAGLFTALYFFNVLLRMLFIKQGIAIWRVGDVGEFLLVLVAMMFFVTGLFAIEERPEVSVAPHHHDPKGGDS